MWPGQHRPLLPVRCRLASSGSLAAQIKPFFPVNTVSPLVIVAPAFPPQQDLYPRKSIPHPRLGDLSDPLPHRLIVALMFRVITAPAAGRKLTGRLSGIGATGLRGGVVGALGALLKAFF